MRSVISQRVSTTSSPKKERKKVPLFCANGESGLLYLPLFLSCFEHSIDFFNINLRFFFKQALFRILCFYSFKSVLNVELCMNVVREEFENFVKTEQAIRGKRGGKT